MVLLFLNGVIVFYIPVTLAQFADSTISAQSAVTTIVTVAVLYVLGLVFAYIVRNQGEALAGKFANHIRLKYFRQLSYLSLHVLRQKHSGYVQSLVNKISDSLLDVLFSIFWAIVPGLFVMVLFLSYIARESFGLALFNIILMTVFLIASVFSARKMIPLIAAKNRGRASMLGAYADFMANISTISQLAVQPYANTVLGVKSQTNDTQIDAVQRYHARRWFILHALFGAAYISTICYLVWQIQQGIGGIGILILFMSAYGTIRGLIESLSENIKLFMEVNAYIEELESMVNLDTTLSPRSGKKADWKSITLRDIAYTHTGSKDTIQIPELAIARHDKICIEEKSGQGKSTLLGIVTNAAAISGGERTVDGVDYQHVPSTFFSNEIAIITQEAELFHLSVRDNLCLGERLSDEKLYEHLRQLELDDWLASLDDGLDSIVGEKGVTMSAGQRQRINILRSVLMDRSLYILDEPTSHLDEHTEHVVVTFLKQHLKTKAILVVTHRPVIRELCDIRYEMKDHTLRPTH